MNDSDRELLEAAARAAGIEVWRGRGAQADMLFRAPSKADGKVTGVEWSPRDDGGDAFRLAAALCIDLDWTHSEPWGPYPEVQAYRIGAQFSATHDGTTEGRRAAARLAIVRCAAAIGAVPCAETK